MYLIAEPMPQMWLEGKLDYRFLLSGSGKDFYNDTIPNTSGKYSWIKGKARFTTGKGTCREGITRYSYDLVKAIRVAGRIKKMEEKYSEELSKKWKPSIVSLVMSRKLTKEQAEEITKICDVLVANTFIILCSEFDYTPIAGKPGDYTRGKEKYTYDVLSELCMFNSAFVSLALGGLRTALAIQQSGHYRKFMKSINIRDVRKAIKTNDSKLAMENWKKLKMFLLNMDVHPYEDPYRNEDYDDDEETSPEVSHYSPFTCGNLHVLELFFNKGIKKTLGTDMQKAWGLKRKKGRFTRGWIETYYAKRDKWS